MRLLSVEKSYGTEYYGEAIVENTTNQWVEELTLNAEFLTGDNALLNTSSAFFTALESGERWYASIPYLGSQNPEKVRVNGRMDSYGYTRLDEGVSLKETSIETGDISVTLTGVVTNNRDSSLSSLYAVAKFRTKEDPDLFLGSGATSVNELKSEQSWQFQVEYLPSTETRLSAINDAEVVFFTL